MRESAPRVKYPVSPWKEVDLLNPSRIAILHCINADGDQRAKYTFGGCLEFRSILAVVPKSQGVTITLVFLRSSVISEISDL